MWQEKEGWENYGMRRDGLEHKDEWMRGEHLRKEERMEDATVRKDEVMILEDKGRAEDELG